MVKYLFGDSQSYKGEFPTIVELFYLSAEKHENRAAFSLFQDDGSKRSYTYGEALILCKKLASYLQQQGLQAGDKVYISGKNSPEWCLVFISVMIAGGVVVPIDPLLNTQFLMNLIDHSDAKIGFISDHIDENLRENNFQGTYHLLSPEVLEKLSQDIIVDESTLNLRNENDTAMILYTSGTTGDPKGVMLSHHNVVFDVISAYKLIKTFTYTDVFYCLLPLHHTYTITAIFMETIYVGAEIICGQHFIFQKIRDDMLRGKASVFLGVPLLFNKMTSSLMKGVQEKGKITEGIVKLIMGFNQLVYALFKKRIGKKTLGFLVEKIGFSHIRLAVSGGGPLPELTQEIFHKLGINFVEGYGLTECSPVLTINPIKGFKVGSVGKIMEGVEIDIRHKNEDGNGEIYVRGPMVMQGYYKNPEKTQEVLGSDGFLKTADIGYVEDDYLFLTGRSLSLIVTEGGKNVYPEELENAFQLYFEIEQILVKGFLKDPVKKTEGIEALIYLTEEFRAEHTLNEMCNFADGIIKAVNSQFIVSKRIEKYSLLTHAMPMSGTKKIKRGLVNEQFNQGLIETLN